MRSPTLCLLGTLGFLIIGYSIPLLASDLLIQSEDLEAWEAYQPSANDPKFESPDGFPIGCFPHFYPNSSQGGSPEDAVDYTISQDTKVRQSGESSVRLEARRSSCDFGLHFKPATVEAGKRYRIKLWLKGENIPSGNRHNGTLIRWQAGTTSSYWGGEEQQSGVSDLPGKVLEGTFDWTPVEFEVQLNENSSNLGFRVILQGVQGTLWIDNASIEQVEE